MHVQLHVWREASRHIDITAFVDRVVDLIGRRVPLDLVLVRRLEAESQRLETVAVGARGDTHVPDNLRTALTEDDVDVLTTWGRWTSVWHERTGASSRLTQLLVPDGVSGDVLAGPLVADGVRGALVLVALHPRRFTEEHRTLAQGLLDPFSAALANDSRLHELARLREAAEAENRSLRSRLSRHADEEDIIGASGDLRWVMERVEQVAQTDTPVLLLGETGSGKEVVAGAIHARSRRAQGPMVRVNCGAIPSELVDSVLFGHEKGSFTSAVASHKGWFERADGGTLFLDEIGELPIAAQVRLLRILQDGTFERVGGQRTLHADVRVIAATHRDMRALVAEGRFRQDLWYRLQIFPIELPPLRARGGDLPALAAHFAAQAGRRLAGVPLRLHPEDVAVLRGYDWPGNVRELAAVIERAALLGGGKALELEAALGVARPTAPRETVARATDDTFAEPAAAHVGPLAEAMRQHIEQALRRTHGQIEGRRGAAALLGINPHTLRSRMRKLRIDWSTFRHED